MRNAIQSAANKVFNDADNNALGYAERLLALGIGDRATAQPYALQWAAEKYDAPIRKTQRSDASLPRGSAAERAMYRVLDVCFPLADKPVNESKTPKTSKHSATPAEKLIAAYLKLDAAQKRSFKAKFAAL